MNKIKILILGTGLVGKQVIQTCENENFDYLTVDLSCADKLADLTIPGNLTKILNEYEPNIVFNTAGVDQKLEDKNKSLNSFELHELPIEEWESIFDKNINITMNVAKESLSFFLNYESNIKRIIFTPSTYSFSSPKPLFYNSGKVKSFAYVASKSIEVSLVKYISKHYSSRGILCNGLVPHLIVDKELEIDEVYLPLMRSAKPEELNPAISLLINPKNTYMTGEFVHVNGGWSN